MNYMSYENKNIESSLFKKRQILIGRDIDSVIANDIVLKLLYLIEQNAKQKITIIINSPGGSVYDGLAILDTMDYAKNQGIIVETICIGKAASMGGVILSHGTYKYRKSLKSSMIMLHQPLVTFGGKTTFTESALKIESSQMSLIRERLEAIVCENTGDNIENVNKILNNDFYMTPYEAKNFGSKGIIDKIIGISEK